MVIDGAKLHGFHTCARILVSTQELRPVDISAVEEQSGQNLSQIIFNAYGRCKQYGIEISGICSDNAENIVAATTSKKSLHLAVFMVHEIIRAACGCHTGQLAIVDVSKTCSEFNYFVSSLNTIISFIKEDANLKEKISAKIPSVITSSSI